jgi:hypothetical protein
LRRTGISDHIVDKDREVTSSSESLQQADLQRLGIIPTPPTDKLCRHCGETKPVADFPSNRHVSDGLSSWCRGCHYEATRQWKARRDRLDA